MVRSFNTQNGLPSLATRKCAMKGDRRDNAATAMAEVAITGAAAAKSANPAARSSVSGNAKVVEDLVSLRTGFSRGSRLMVDTTKRTGQPDPNRSIGAVPPAYQASYNFFAFFLLRPPSHGVAERHMIVIQNSTRGAFQGRARFQIGALRHHYGGFGLCQKALVLNDEETGRRAHFKLG